MIQNDLESENLLVSGKELTVYYSQEVLQATPRLCRFCGSTSSFVEMFKVEQIVDGCYNDIDINSSLFNEAQAALRKNRGHDLVFCNNDGCVIKHEREVSTEFAEWLDSVEQ
jgi:hypothetical protein